MLSLTSPVSVLCVMSGGRDAEVGKNPRRQRVGDDAAAGVQLGEEIGGKGKRGLRFFSKGPVPVQPCRDGPDAFGAALQGGYAAVIKDLADGWSYPKFLSRQLLFSNKRLQ